MLNKKKRSRRETTMEEDGVVHIKVFYDEMGDVVFDGKVSTHVTPQELSRLRCFRERGLRSFWDKATMEEVRSFKGMENFEFIAFSGPYLSFSGVLYRCDDGVLRSSKRVPTCECVMMTVLKMSHEQCENVFKCETLEDLEINECKLRQIPSDIGKLKKLKKLRLYWLKELMRIPEEIDGLSNLKELWIESCGIQSLPKSIGGLKELEEVNLCDLYSLESIPEEIGCLSNLKKLEIRYCSIESLPKRIRELKQLAHVRLEDLPELQLDPEIIVSFSRLTELSVCDCDDLFQGNGANVFCQMLRMSVNLCNVKLDWEKEQEEMLREALLENGSIISLGPLNPRLHLRMAIVHTTLNMALA